MTWLVAALVLSGLFFMVVAAIGMLRFPDMFSRSHALGVTDTVGLALSLAGLACYQGFTLTAAKTLAVLVLLWLFNPVITHVTARAALRTGLRPWMRERCAPELKGADMQAEEEPAYQGRHL